VCAGFGAPEEDPLNAISGPTQTAVLSQLMTNAAVRPVRPVTSNAQRASLEQVDRYEPSAASRSASLSVASVTYGRNGTGGGARADADGDRD
jgi:hypothetical protein